MQPRFVRVGCVRNWSSTSRAWPPVPPLNCHEPDAADSIGRRALWKSVMNEVKNVLIIGGGITGLTAAACLGRQGIKVDLIEVRSRIEDQGGIGLSVIGKATEAPDTIGDAQKSVGAGMPAYNNIVRTSYGKSF